MPYKRSVADGFKLININAHLLENGYDSATEYIYESADGKKYTITEKFKAFVDPAVYNSFQALESNFGHNLYFVEHNARNTTKIIYLIGMYFGEITGDISTNDALNILKSLV
ncbi:MAG: hypothetical protein VR72_06275 [Clostridiaceae bacterium BRH_c20a]|nr:MAG: hypothetical protein VR72_06275 [Clostridiaceae bacterium BRH_c20a]